MTKKELIKKLRKYKEKNILIKIEGGLFYPIKDIKKFDENILIICEDITKVTKQ